MEVTFRKQETFNLLFPHLVADERSNSHLVPHPAQGNGTKSWLGVEEERMGIGRLEFGRSRLGYSWMSQLPGRI